MRLHDRDHSSEGDGGVALGLEEVLNTETVLSLLIFIHVSVENFVLFHLHLAYGRQRSGQREEQWGGEQQFGTEADVVSCPSELWLM